MSEAPKEKQLKKVPDHAPTRVQAKQGTIKKKPFWKKIKEALFVEGARSVGLYLWQDVMLPAIKKLVADSATNAINMAVYGDSRPRYSNGTHTGNSSVYSGRAANQSRAYYNRTNRYQTILNGVIFSHSDVPMQIIQEAMAWIEEYGCISVETFNQILPPELAFDVVHTDRNWGWTSLNENCVVNTPGGWMIDLPPAKPL